MAKTKPPAGPGPTPLCVSNFTPGLVNRVLPKEFSTGFGLNLRGSVAAGFIPDGFSFAPASPFEGITLQSDATWGKGAEITVGFFDGTPAFRKRVQELAELWPQQSGATVSFKFGTPVDRAQVRVTFSGQGFKSMVGREAESVPRTHPTMTLAFRGHEPDAEWRRLVLHEFGHALGYMHEQSHPDNGIKWDRNQAIAAYKPLLPPGMSGDDIMRQLEALPRDSFRYKFYPFDPKSIMMYMIPRAAVASGWRDEFGNNNTELSDSDRAICREMYGGTGPTPPATATPLVVGGPPAANSIAADGEVDEFTFTAPADGGYEITTEGTAIVHVDLTDAAGNPTFDGDTGGDSISPRVGVMMLRLLDGGKKYRLRVTASRFAPMSTGAYSVRVRPAP